MQPFPTRMSTRERRFGTIMHFYSYAPRSLHMFFVLIENHAAGTVQPTLSPAPVVTKMEA